MNARPAFLAAVSTALLLASVAAPNSLKAQGKSLQPCALLSTEQIKAVLGTLVLAGKPATFECTWSDPKGNETRVYLSVKDATPEYKSFRDSMQATGKLVPVTGLAEDAFYIAGTGSSAALYALKAKHLLLITVDGIGFSKAQNEAAEKGLVGQILPKL